MIEMQCFKHLVRFNMIVTHFSKVVFEKDIIKEFWSKKLKYFIIFYVSLTLRNTHSSLITK
ncbi:hypothetical protein NUSPORA_02348 [Nucleospora cyclopteri]